MPAWTPNAWRPIEAVRHLGDRPLLLIHGGADALLWPENARLLRGAASGSTALWLVPDAPHAGAYGLDPRAYVDRLDTFIQGALTSARDPQAQS